jgi:hypothetical protein
LASPPLAQNRLLARPNRMIPVNPRTALSAGLLWALAATTAGATQDTRKVITNRDSFGPGRSNIQSILVVVQALKAR